MRIGIDISQLVYKGTGVANYTTNLVRYLSQENKKDSYILFGSSLRQRFLLKKFVQRLKGTQVSTQILPFPLRVLDFLWNRIHLIPVECFTGSIDIFHSSDWIQPPSKARKVTTIHDLVVFQCPKYLDKQIIATQKRRLSWVVKECDAIIADSHATKKDIQHYLNIDSKKIHVVYLGIDECFVSQSKNAVERVKRKYNLPEEYILSIGTIEPRKNFARTIQAFQTIQHKIPHYLVIAGKQGWGASITKSERIVNLGFVAANDLPALYTGASCFIYPSLYEGFGLPVLEALACGCIVICSDKGSLGEIAGKTPFFVDPEDVESIAHALEKVLKLSRTACSRRVRQGIAHAKQFTWKKTARETLNVYRKLLL